MTKEENNEQGTLNVEVIEFLQKKHDQFIIRRSLLLVHYSDGMLNDEGGEYRTRNKKG